MKKIVANFKMNLVEENIGNYLEELSNEKITDNVIFCPSYIFLKDFIKNNYMVGAQNIHSEEKGAFTAEISANQLASIGVKYCIVGHSERRNIFNESDEAISKKVSLLESNNIIPILCIGEKEGEEYKKKLTKQIDSVFLKNNYSDIVIAYEPIWSIGNGKTATTEIIEEVSSFIKNYIFEKYNLNLEILYGGSVNLDNASSILDIKSISGLLIGGASLSSKNMINIMKLRK